MKIEPISYAFVTVDSAGAVVRHQTGLAEQIASCAAARGTKRLTSAARPCASNCRMMRETK